MMDSIKSCRQLYEKALKTDQKNHTQKEAVREPFFEAEDHEPFFGIAEKTPNNRPKSETGQRKTGQRKENDFFPWKCFLNLEAHRCAKIREFFS